MLLRMPGTYVHAPSSIGWSPIGFFHSTLYRHCPWKEAPNCGSFGLLFSYKKKAILTRTRCCIVKGKALQVVQSLAPRGSCLSPSCSWGMFVAQHRPETTLPWGHWLRDVQKATAQDQHILPLGPYAAYLSQIFYGLQITLIVDEFFRP